MNEVSFMKKIPNYIKRLILLLFLLFIGFLPFLGFGIRVFQFRYINCAPNELIPVIKNVFGLDFPKDIKELKTAKTSMDRAVLFLVKFKAEPNGIDRLIGSIQSYKIGPEPYKRGYTFIFANGFPAPAWARKSIKQGIKYTFHSVKGEIGSTAHIYIDDTDKKNMIVYIEGDYDESSENIVETSENVKH